MLQIIGKSLVVFCIEADIIFATSVFTCSIGLVEIVILLIGVKIRLLFGVLYVALLMALLLYYFDLASIRLVYGVGLVRK